MKILHCDAQPGKAATDDWLVFLHGFPSIRSKQNREIAAAVNAELGWPTDLLLYSGLGCAPGEFTFSGCVDEVGDYFAKLLRERDRKIDLIGHSWGGFVSLLMASRYPERVRRLVLMSPLLWFASEAEVYGGFTELTKEHADLNLGNTSDLVRDFCLIGEKYPTASLIKGLSPATEVLFLQAKVDPLTPAEIAIKMKDLFPRPPIFELVDNDHSFLSDRPQLSQRIAKFLREGQ